MNATDYATLRGGAGLLELNAWGVVEVTGADRAAFLHNLLSQDVKTLKPGEFRRAALLTSSAKLIAELVVAAEPDRHWLLMPRACLTPALAALDRYIISEDVAVADRSAAWTLLAVQGPKALEVMAAVAGLRTAGYSLTGEPGVIVMAAASQAAAMKQQLVNAGAVPVSEDAVNVRRVETGIPAYGIDMDENTLLPETGLDQQLASFTKGCYVGQEIVARMDTYGSASRKLMKLLCDGTEAPSAGDVIQKDGEEIGRITSAVFSPSLGRPAAMGYVKRPFYEAGTSVTVGSRAIAAVLA